MKSAKKSIGPVLCLLLVPVFLFNRKGKIKPDPYEFTILKRSENHSCKKTSTRRVLAGRSRQHHLIESELIRIWKGEHILSPMWNVRFIYPLKQRICAIFGIGGF